MCQILLVWHLGVPLGQDTQSYWEQLLTVTAQEKYLQLLLS